MTVNKRNFFNTGDIKLLSGKWSFTPEGARNASSIYVPSHWTHGECFGYPENWEHVTHGTYRRTVVMPAYDAARICVFRFEAVMLSCEVFLNRTHLGGHRGGFTPFECAVTEQLWRAYAGQAVELRVEVDSAKSAFTPDGVIHQVGYPDDGEEGPVPGGIWQDVWITTRPKIRAAAWNIDYHHAGRSAVLTVSIVNESADVFSGILMVKCGSLSSVLPVMIADGELKLYQLNLNIPAGMREWSMQSPCLHKLTLAVLDGSRRRVDTLTDRVGFREVAVHGEKLLLNGVPTRLFGLSLIRHRVAPYLWRRDYLTLYFKTLKSLGINALRLHAAIAPPIVLRIADELGIAVINQSSVWSTVVSGYTAAGERFIENTRREYSEWFARDRNHPSVLIWDVENEQIKIDTISLPWVNKLIAHMRTLTTMPVCASGAGSLGDDDFIHMHCAPNLHLMARGKSFAKPFIAGEWWGPNLEYHDTLRSPLKITDPRSQEHLFEEIARFYEREILAQRRNGMAGTFPFGYEVLLFQPLFRKGERIKLPSTGYEYPFLSHAEQFCRGANYHVARRLLVNPGWDPAKPRLRFSKPLAAALKTAFSPVVLIPEEDNIDFYAGTELLRTFVVCNDSGSELSGTFCVRLRAGDQITEANTVTIAPAGQNTELVFRLRLPPADRLTVAVLSATFTTNAGIFTSQTAVRLWPVMRIVNPGRPLAIMGADNRLRAHLRRMDIPFVEKCTVPDEPCILIVQEFSPETDAGSVARFMACGGRIIALRQEAAAAALLLPFKFKPARVLIREEFKDVVTDERQINCADHVPLTAPRHPLVKSIPGNEIHPFAAGDHRVVDDAYLRPVNSGLDIAGEHVIAAACIDRSQVSLAELRRKDGLIIVCQLHLLDNLGIDPQADVIFADMIERANEYVPSNRTLACDDMRVIKTLASTLDVQARLVHPDYDPGEAAVFVITTPAGAVTALRLMEDKSSSFCRWLKAGGVCVLAPSRLAHAEFTLSARVKGKVIASDIGGRGVFGWNSEDFLKIIDAENCGVITSYGRGFYEILRLWQLETEGVYGGLTIAGHAGSALIERRMGKGVIYLTSVNLRHTGERTVMVLWQSMLSRLGIRIGAVPTNDVRTVIARRTIPLPLDGDIRKWTNEEADVNIAPWSRALPNPVDERNVNVGEKNSQAAKKHGCIFYALYDDNNLYFAAKLLADKFDFSEVESFCYERSSVEFRVREAYVFASRGKDGRPFVMTRNFKQNSPESVEVALRLFPDDSECPDREMLMLDKAAPFVSALFEVKIPFAALPYDIRPVPGESFEVSFALNAHVPGPFPRLQCSLPKEMVWDDPSTFVRMMLQPEKSS